MSGRRPIPKLMTDEQAEAFVENADLTEYDLSAFRPARFEFEKKTARVNMRLPESLLQAIRNEARRQGIPYQRFIRQVLERAVAESRCQTGR